MAIVVVIGAGVIGLTTALTLAQKGHTVKIIAKNVPGDFDFGLNYTSPMAGANWHSFAEDDEYEVQEYDKIGYKTFKELCHVPNSGVHKCKSYNYITKDETDDSVPWFIKEKFVDGVETNLSIEEMSHEDFAYGYKYENVIISTTIYLNFLLQECYKLGVSLHRKSLTSVNEVFENFLDDKVAFVFNCSGLLAKYLVNDTNVYGIKGQTVLVENSSPHEMIVHYGETDELLYIMPRKEGGCVIGGCKKPVDLDDTEQCEAVDYDFFDRLKEIAVKYNPYLIDPNYMNNAKELKIVRYQVGLRPGRKGGYRVEVDPLDKRLVHCYGHGGAGYQSSYGSVYKAIELAGL